MLSDVIRQLNKIRKKHGNEIPVYYMYAKANEMTLAELSEVHVMYTNLDLFGMGIFYTEYYDESNFVTESKYDPNTHKDFIPIVIITEKLNDDN